MMGDGGGGRSDWPDCFGREERSSSLLWADGWHDGGWWNGGEWWMMYTPKVLIPLKSTLRPIYTALPLKKRKKKTNNKKKRKRTTIYTCIYAT